MWSLEWSIECKQKRLRLVLFSSFIWLYNFYICSSFFKMLIHQKLGLSPKSPYRTKEYVWTCCAARLIWINLYDQLLLLQVVLHAGLLSSVSMAFPADSAWGTHLNVRHERKHRDVLADISLTNISAWRPHYPQWPLCYQVTHCRQTWKNLTFSKPVT